MRGKGFAHGGVSAEITFRTTVIFAYSATAKDPELVVNTGNILSFSSICCLPLCYI
jgi:hypothetical protein